MATKMTRVLPILFILAFVILGCRCSKPAPVQIPFEPSKINPYRGNLVGLPAPIIYGKGYERWRLYKTEKTEIPTAIEASKLKYAEIKANFDSTTPWDVDVVIANFPSKEAALAHFEKAIISGVKGENSSDAVKAVVFNEVEIGRSYKRSEKTYWTSGSIYCEFNARHLPDDFYRQMLAH